MLRQLTLEEKVSLLSGADVWRTAAIDRLTVGSIKVTDGPNGARGDSTTGATAVCLPATIGLGASFDRDLAVEFGRLLGRETKRKGAQVLLAPTVNIARHPLGGRNFESFGEDPFLTAELAVAYVQGVQSEGVAACGKHFVANDVEYARMTVSSEVDEAVLREVYLAPFEALVEAGVWSLMASYPMLNGRYCTENHWLLTTVLRDEWGFDGLVMSDWGATHHRSRPVVAGLDLEMPGPARALGPDLLEAIAAGEVTEDVVDRRAAAVLELARRTGRLGTLVTDAEQSLDWPEDRTLARRVAAEGMVLLGNNDVLPLDGETLETVAVIGPNADPGVIQGGGSAQVPAHYSISPLDGLVAALPGPDVRHERGCLAHRYLPVVAAGQWLGDGEAPLRLELFEHPELDGEPITTRSARLIRAFLQGDHRRRVGSQRWTGQLRIDANGAHRFGVLAVGRSRVLVNGRVVADNWTAPEPGDSFFQWSSDEVTGTIELHAGSTAEVVVEWSLGTDGPLVGLRFGHLPPIDEDQLLDNAVDAAAEADAAIVVVGLNNEWETEGHDRLMFELPGRQNELIERVARANHRTIVIINAGGPVAAPWFDDVGAVLMAWYPGQELGSALADVLLGQTEPGGRLPMTWPRSLDDAPFRLPDAEPGPARAGTKLPYSERLLVGYRSYDRRDVEPLAPFGHGLGYTSFDLESATLDGPTDTGPVTVRVVATNSGDRPGKCVVQVYVESPSTGSDRPLRALAGFATCRLDPGSGEELRIDVPARAFAHWDENHSDGNTAGWAEVAGRHRLHVGTSSRELAHILDVKRSGHYL